MADPCGISGQRICLCDPGFDLRAWHVPGGKIVLLDNSRQDLEPDNIIRG